MVNETLLTLSECATIYDRSGIMFVLGCWILLLIIFLIVSVFYIIELQQKVRWDKVE